MARASRARVGGLLVGGSAAVAMGVLGCTSVTGGDATVRAGEGPAYRSSMSVSSSQAAASSSARESERQASLTAQAVLSACDTLSATSAEAIDAVNAYVSAFNDEGGDVASTEGPAVDALNNSAGAVESDVSDVVPEELKDALFGWVNGAYATADAIVNEAPPSEFNSIISDLNDARSEALRLCDATYR
ncbi:MAG: hypothetical protein ACKOB8_13160 [Mycobacterium sp.]